MSWKKFVAGFDIHGDRADKKAVSKFFQFIDQFKPDIRICGGDVWDFRALRRGASEEERRDSMAADYAAGKLFLQQFKPNYLTLGNHCHRLWELAEADRGALSDYAQQGVDEIETWAVKAGCRILPYHKRLGVLQLGKLRIIHGFWSGLNADRQAAMTYGACLQGHVHTVSEFAIPGLERRVARSCGCLCQLDMDYNSRTPSSLRHAHGFAYGVIDSRTGLYHAWQAESIGGKWIVPSDIVELK